MNYGVLLSERFDAASHSAPLNDLASHDREELASLLARVNEFEDLPGRWQAALLIAEDARTPPAHGCCHHHPQ
jgi:hypothetical protein